MATDLIELRRLEATEPNPAKKIAYREQLASAIAAKQAADAASAAAASKVAEATAAAKAAETAAKDKPADKPADKLGKKDIPPGAEGSDRPWPEKVSPDEESPRGEEEGEERKPFDWSAKLEKVAAALSDAAEEVASFAEDFEDSESANLKSGDEEILDRIRDDARQILIDIRTVKSYVRGE